MYPENPKDNHQNAPPAPPPMFYPPPPGFPGYAMQPFPFPYGNGFPPAAPPPAFGYPFPGNPEKGMIPFPMTGAPPCSAAGGSVVYLQRIGTATSDATPETPWSTSLFGCFADFTSCFKTCFCPCITSGQIAEIASEGKTSCLEATIIHGILLYLFIVPCVYTCHNRSKLRKRFRLMGNSFTDCVVHAFCCYCALCQEYRELYHHGYDPAIGWMKNVERDRNTIAMFRITPPVVEKGMAR